ncbi:uncharacterized protein HMPREF1541_08606 [Cyphellophora europaea CBS 101466]|uniref:Uncharacterized protein n=1 Tax=Cyphellophora europaea (strain CBS 101466) TaxID=1220924 RepID=W2RKS1_CYPE1|nr:uncharacterized protein HMPREF1541_08606 [Cyphellophora europaea CBS 101466]ETN36329.1 hypothetical protein HMPREF1541_08606 [Cyphellophora europaea CBS 101466]
MSSEPPLSSTDPSSQSLASTTSDSDTIYFSLSSYPFDDDPEYLAGLSSILGHPSIPPNTAELTSNPDLILQARCFYFARKHNLSPIDPAAYSKWLAENSSARTTTAPSGTSQPGGTAPAGAPPAPTLPFTANEVAPNGSEVSEQPPYPTSFAEIVDLITRNVPVPGIEEIPNTVLEHGSSKVDHTPRRRKPWEKDGETTASTISDTDVTGGPVTGGAEGAGPDSEISGEGTEQNADDAKVNGHLETGEGVVKILQANAIPDSGLLAKD